MKKLARVVKVSSVPPDRIILSLRHSDRSKTRVEVTGFKPHFYAPGNGGFKSIFGEDLRKVVVSDFRLVPQERAKFRKHYQADIPYARNFLLATGVRYGVIVPNGDTVGVEEIVPAEVSIAPRRCYIDIEVAGEGSLDTVQTPAPVVAFSAWDNYEQRLFTAVVGKGISDIDKGIYFVGNERELFQSISSYLRTTDPDVLIGWNVGYDTEYLRNRGERLGFKLYFPETFDLKEADMKLHRRLSHSLKDVAVEEGLLKEEDVVNAMDAIERYEQGDVEFLVKYNRHDVEIMVELDKKYGITEFFEGLKDYAGVAHYDDTLKFSVLVDTMLLRLAREIGVILPSAPERPEEGERYTGAIVDFFTEDGSPRKGIFENVAVFDFSRYYPSLIKSLNISPEVSGPEDKPGIIPRLVEKLFAERNKIEAELEQHIPGTPEYETLKQKRNVVKFLTNACFCPGTEILTPNGLKRVENIQVGDLVYVLNPETFQVETTRVVDTQVFDYNGTIFKIGGKHSACFFLVTPEHRFYLRERRSSFSWLRAWDFKPQTYYRFPRRQQFEGKEVEYFYLSDNATRGEVGVLSSLHGKSLIHKLKRLGVPVKYLRQGYISSAGRWGQVPFQFPRKAGRFQKLKRPRKSYSFYYGSLSKLRPYLDTLAKFGQVKIREARKRTNWVPYKFLMNDWLEFIGWYVSEGSLHHNKPRLPRGESFCIQLSQLNPEGRKKIEDLLKRMQVTYIKGKGGYTICSKLIYDFLKKECGEGAENKRLPKWVFDLSVLNLRHLYQALMSGDGCVGKIIKIGRVVPAGFHYRTKSWRLAQDFIQLGFLLGMCPRYTFDRKEKIWNIQFTSFDGFSSKNIKIFNYSGKVYCFTTERHHIVFGGYGGVLNFVGQCYGFVGASFTRLYNRERAAKITEAGRDGLQHMAEFARECGFEPVYGDTDSIMVQIPFDKAKAFERMLNEEAEAYFRKKYGAQECNMKMDFNYYAKKILFTGVKKRYAAHAIWQHKPCDYLRVVGFETVRSDQSKFTQEVQRTLFDLILRGTREQAVAFVRKALEDFRKQPLERIAFRKGIEKPLAEYGVKERTGVPSHIRGALYSNQVFGTNFGAGSKPLYLYVKGIIGKPPTDIVAFERKVPDGCVVDWERMEQLTLRGKISEILDAAGISWEEVEGKPRGKQRSLADFV